MFRVRTKTFNLTINEAHDAKVDGNGYALFYKKVQNIEGKDYMLPVAVIGPYDFLSSWDPEHVQAVEIPVPEKNA